MKFMKPAVVMGFTQNKLTIKVKCCVKGCRRMVRPIDVIDEDVPGDGWGRVISYNNEDMFICPLHRLALEEHGNLEKKRFGVQVGLDERVEVVWFHKKTEHKMKVAKK